MEYTLGLKYTLMIWMQTKSFKLRFKLIIRATMST